jgi:hypothetical protein
MDSMFDWMKGLGRTLNARARAAEAPAEEPVANAGEYELLYKYLRDRFANRVVLTFGEIEDLLGFTLPPLARAQGTWWGATVPVGSRSTQSDAWTRAGRTATVNLMAQSVVFEREDG